MESYYIFIYDDKHINKLLSMVSNDDAICDRIFSAHLRGYEKINNTLTYNPHQITYGLALQFNVDPKLQHYINITKLEPMCNLTIASDPIINNPTCFILPRVRRLRTIEHFASTDDSFFGDNFIFFQRGNIPILITAPHGGTLWRNNKVALSKRVLRKGDVSVNDGTNRLMRDLMKAFSQDTHKPYFLIANFSREYIDANRAPNENAYPNSLINAQVYDAYHNIIKEFIAGGGKIIIDMHGCSVTNNAVANIGIIRDDALTITEGDKAAVQAFGNDLSIGIMPIFGNFVQDKLTNNGNNFFGSSMSADCQWSGGYTIRTYGNTSTSISALQIEHTRPIRANADVRAEYVKRFYRSVIDNFT